MPELTQKQQRFCEEYLIDCNATQAAIRAGYSPATARAIGAENLTKPDIKRRIAEARTEIRVNNKKLADQVMRELARLAFEGLSCFIRIDADGTPRIDLGACSASDIDRLAEVVIETRECRRSGERIVKARLKLHSRLRALDLLARILGFFDQSSGLDPDTELQRTLDEMGRRGSRPPLRRS